MVVLGDHDRLVDAEDVPRPEARVVGVEAREVTHHALGGDAVLDEAYAHCDLFVAPSRFESFGLVFVEAMRVGKAVIGCRAGGMPEVVADGLNGLLVEPGDPAGLADALVRLAGDPALRRHLQAGARHTADTRLDWQQIGQRILADY